MKYGSHTIHLLRPMEQLDLDRIFPRGESKRKRVFRLISEGITVSEWLAKVERADFQKVDISFITQCYAKDDATRIERRLVELRAPVQRAIGG